MVSGKVLEETYRKWELSPMCRNQDELRSSWSLLFGTLAGLFCNRTFDVYACWPDAPAGTMVNISCPFYLPWYEKGNNTNRKLKVVRLHREIKIRAINCFPSSGAGCCAEAMWPRRPLGDGGERPGVERQLMVTFRTVYTVGYSLSLFSLLTALVVLMSFRRLRCTRNYIHANLFLSFILRAVAVIVKDAMVDRHWGKEIMKTSDVSEMLSHQAAIGCRIAQVTMQYFVLANHYWFFGEAIYLYSVLIASVLVDNNKYLLYICLGWGTPLLFVAPWVVVKLLKENKECWAVNENLNYWWIIRSPVLLASLVNFMIFVKILKVIFTKLRAGNPNRYPDYKLRLAKSTLTLIPLFGIHEIVFIFATDEHTSGIVRCIKVFFSLFISSFQGFLVAILYCFANKEVCCFISCVYISRR
uniref:Glucagon receptor n=1 Tax=Salarias fasciatus TaxID=181472 RepID=A0A672FXM8_SALFA